MPGIKKGSVPLPDDYDPTDWKTALETAHEWGDRIPTGIIYRDDGLKPLEQKMPGLKKGSLIDRPVEKKAFQEVMGKLFLKTDPKARAESPGSGGKWA